MFCRINFAVPIKPDLVRFDLITFETLQDGNVDINEYEIVLHTHDIADNAELMTQLTFKIRELMYMDEQCRNWEGLEWKM